MSTDTVSKLKKVMKEFGKNSINVASDTGLSPTTVAKALKRGSVNNSTEQLLLIWIEKQLQRSNTSDGPEAA